MTVVTMNKYLSTFSQITENGDPHFHSKIIAYINDFESLVYSKSHYS